MFFKSDIEQAKKRKLEEQLYEKVAQELYHGKKHNAVWAKSLAKSKGNLDVAQSLYIEYRMQSLIDEIVIQEEERKIQEYKNKQKKAMQEKELQKKKEKDKELGVPYSIYKKILNDGYCFLSKHIVRKNGTWDDYVLRNENNKILITKNDKIIAEYPIS